MPEWYYAWQLSWLNWWHDHPVLWGSALFGALVVYVVCVYVKDVRKLNRY